MALSVYGMQTNVFAIIILFIIYFRNISKTEKKADRLFDCAIFSTIIILLLDTAIFLFDGRSVAANIAAVFLYYAFTPVVGFFAMVYLEYKMEHNVNSVRRLGMATLPFLILYVIICVIDIWHDWIFFIDDDAVYHRGEFFWVSEILCFAFLAVPVVKAIRAVRVIDDKAARKTYFSVIYIMIPVVIGAAIQFFLYGISTNWLGATISIFIMFIDFQNTAIMTDPLTGINNRRVLYRYLSDKTSLISSKERLFVYIIDVDRFKSINDRYGHAEGDRALVYITEILKTACRGQDDFISRMGGDEFAVVSIRRKSDKSPGLGDTIRRAADDFNARGLTDYKLSVSIGCAEYGQPDTGTVDDLMKKADDYMYAEKKGKKEALE